ncbi:MAG: yeeN [Parcubacteria group bacterium Gr01-1014_107]|nr:MAG: yeeN [Parcubacteria group bacterium Gr01-1014_107]
MAGHSKWSKVKHKKAVSDAKKSKIFSKVIRLLNVEAKKAGGDANSPSLKAAIEKAKAYNIPKDNIERAIQKGKGDSLSQTESINYEAYGPGGVAIIIEALTDNRNKTAAEIKHILSEHGLNLSGIGSALWAFERVEGGWKPKTIIKLSEEDENILAEIIDNLEENDDVQEIYTNTE